MPSPCKFSAQALYSKNFSVTSDFCFKVKTAVKGEKSWMNKTKYFTPRRDEGFIGPATSERISCSGAVVILIAKAELGVLVCLAATQLRQTGLVQLLSIAIPGV